VALKNGQVEEGRANKTLSLIAGSTFERMLSSKDILRRRI
jgi:hypothetical protein